MGPFKVGVHAWQHPRELCSAGLGLSIWISGALPSVLLPALAGTAPGTSCFEENSSPVLAPAPNDAAASHLGQRGRFPPLLCRCWRCSCQPQPCCGLWEELTMGKMHGRSLEKDFWDSLQPSDLRAWADCGLRSPDLFIFLYGC